MNLKKFISGVSALAIAASAFAGMAVTANAAATDTMDYTPYSDINGVLSWNFCVDNDSTTETNMIAVGSATDDASNSYSDGDTVPVKRGTQYGGLLDYNGVCIRFNKDASRGLKNVGSNGLDLQGANTTADSRIVASWIQYTAPCDGTLKVTANVRSNAKLKYGTGIAAYGNNYRVEDDNAITSGTAFDCTEGTTYYIYNDAAWSGKSDSTYITSVSAMTFTPAKSNVNYVFDTVTGDDAAEGVLTIKANMYGGETKTGTVDIGTSVSGTGKFAVTFMNLPACVNVESVTLN